MSWRFLFLFIFCIISCKAYGFGTHSFFDGQNSEHEKITRAGLSCKPKNTINYCFDRSSLRLLAGGTGFFGAVGIADDPLANLISESDAHCDNADYNVSLGDKAKNPSKEEAGEILNQCKEWINKYFNLAVKAAGNLTDADGAELIPSETIIVFDRTCTFNTGNKISAKCQVFSYLGLALHATQDFYSHSNWTDSNIVFGGVYNPYAPPGLGMRGPSPWLDMPAKKQPIPKGLITGCFVFLGSCGERSGHEHLNKDKGEFINNTPGLGLTRRGSTHNNFANAADAAIQDTTKKIVEFKIALNEMYGEQQADLIFCALLKDKPMKSCDF